MSVGLKVFVAICLTMVTSESLLDQLLALQNGIDHFVKDVRVKVNEDKGSDNVV